MNEHIVERHGVEIDLSYEHSTVCPRCARNGRDTSGDNFHVYGLDKNGKYLGGYCWCCEYTIPSEQWLEENGDVVVEEDPVGKEFNNEIHEEIKKRTKVDGNNFRGIKKETSIYFGVRYDVNEDKSVKEVYYPVTKNYELSGYKVRIVPKDFTSYGETGKDCDLFGQFRFKNSSGRYCVITSGECYSSDTEVFTGDGWKLFSELDDSDLLMQIENGVGSLVKPLRLIKKEYSGEMISFKSNYTIDILVTPNHKMVGIDHKMQDLYFRADQPLSTRNGFRKAIKFAGDGIDLSDDQIKFIIAVCADAKIDTRVSGKRVAHFLFHKDRKIARLKEILQSLDLQYTEYTKSDHGKNCRGLEYHTFNVVLPDWVVNKKIPKSWIVGLNQHQRKLFLDEIILWDGNHCSGDGFEFTSKHFDEVDTVSSIALLNNMHTNVRKRKNAYGEWYVVRVSRRKSHSSFQNVKKTTVDYEGFVYCATVPSGQLLVRRNGKVIVCGNSDQLAAFQMLKDYNDSRGSEYEPIPVVSSTIGESGSHKQIQNQYEWFNRFEKIILCYDMDDAGFAAVDKVAKVLPKGKVFVMQLPMKDANDMLKAGKQKEFINCFFKATAYVPSGIVGSGNLLDKIREAEKVQKIPLPPFMHNVQDLMAGGIPLKKIVNLGSASGTGKSTIIDEMVYYWIFNSPHLCGVVTLESDCAEYGKKLLSRHIGKKIDLISDYDKKQEFLASPEVELAAKDLFYFRDGTHRFHLVEERDGSIDDIKNLIMQLIIQCECKIIILDPLQDVLDGMNIDEQSVFMKWMKGATKSHDVTFINVNHVRKSGSGQTANSAGADLHEEDFQGSSSIFKSGACNLLFTRNKEHESPIMRNVTKMKMTKCRWSGKTSPKAGMFYYDNESHTLHDLDDWLTMHPEAAKEID